MRGRYATTWMTLLPRLLLRSSFSRTIMTGRSSILTPDKISTVSDLYADGTINSHAKEAGSASYHCDLNFNSRISLLKYDITKLQVDMIVNAANQSLLGGGGVDGAIHDAAGPDLYKECKTLGGAKTGETKVTGGYKLPAKKIAHTVGPVYRAYSESVAADKLHSCYQSCLERCAENGGGSLAFCCISTGAYTDAASGPQQQMSLLRLAWASSVGFPLKAATEIALDTVRNYLREAGNGSTAKIDRVIFCCYSERDEDMYKQLIPRFFPAETPMSRTVSHRG